MPSPAQIPSTPNAAAAFAKSNGIELCYDTVGDPKLPPIVLIMGMGAQMIAWDDEFCAELAAHGYYVIRFDNRDAGLSTHLESADVPDISAALLAARLLFDLICWISS